MNVILGIDTGGTYTDGAIVRFDTKEVLRYGKTFTTKENLIVGIRNCIDKLQIKEDENVCLVCLSTTLATNAIVEGKNSRVGLITISAPSEDNFPSALIIDVHGKMNIMGREIEPISEEEVTSALNSMKGHVEALAVSGYASVRNHDHELFVKKLASKILDVPVVCAHELTSALGFYERTVTAVLNAKLLPIIKELVDDTRAALIEQSISAPISIVKGDGHLMVDNFAESRPVETILSGPAASMIGGEFLTELKNAVIVDMGGTTTDILFVVDGEVMLEKEGASIGGWMTRVNAVKAYTFGLGGDSYLRTDSFGKITFGPNKVVPLCIAAVENPLLYNEIKEYKKDIRFVNIKRQEVDCFRLFKKNKLNNDELNETDCRILELLKDRSHSILYLSEMIGKDIESLGMQKLMDLELVQLISMTPTDILHASGEFNEWSTEAAKIGAELCATSLGICVDEFIKQTEEQFVYQVSRAILESACNMDGIDTDAVKDKISQFFINNALSKSRNTQIEYTLKLKNPIIGIGAPASVWVAKAAKLLDAELILPDYESVANAIGAAVGNVRENLKSLICYDPHISKYIAYLPNGRQLFKSLEEAKQCTRQQMTLCSQELAEKLAVEDIKITIDEEDEYQDNVCTKDKIFVKTVMTAVISGTLKTECIEVN